MKNNGLISSRRAALRGVAAGVVALPVLARAPVHAAKRRTRFFSVAELALVDVLTELIIPADEHAPGARAAEVAWEIDRRLADSDPRQDAALRNAWREGLRRLDALSRRTHGVPHFVRATEAQQVALLETLAAGEQAAQKNPTQAFFVLLKAETARAYYGSELGLMQEFGYQGNVYLPEFVGIDLGQAPRKG